MPTNSREKMGYPTQKPLGILRRIVTAASRPGDLVLDFFAGSGTAGAAALELGRRFLLVDDNPQAIAVMRRRFAGRADVAFSAAPRRARRVAERAQKTAANRGRAAKLPSCASACQPSSP